MKVLMTGATGLVGTALTQALVRDGHTVCRMVRRETVSRKADSPSQAAGPRVIDVPWDPEASDGLTFADSQGEIAGAEAVVNLAGAPIAEGRWTQQRKMVLRSSRVRTTRALVTAIGRLKSAPKVLISASAIGYYGDRGDEVLTEESKPGDNFLARIAMEWEAEAKKAEALGMRMVLTRFGVILAKHGGALPAMMKPFQFFVGGKMGSGQQWISWITLEDVLGIMRYALDSVGVSGVINVVAPQPVRNAEFARELARVMHRPALVPAPAFALRLALGGEMADSMLLASERVLPTRLQQSPYRFRHDTLPEALSSVR
jgi:uncharacterized protein